MERGIGAILAMSAAYFYITVAVLLVALLTYIAAHRGGKPLALDKARAIIDSLDIQAFRNLVNPEEEEFLRASLAPDQFRRIRRERARAAFAYTRTLSQIALEFSRFGHAMRHSTDPRLVELGRQVVSSAVLLRLRALEASGRLLVTVAFPDLPQRYPHPLFEQYARSAGLLLRYRAFDYAQEQVS
ncbi:MAG: hypothetical protein ABSG02_04005 [Terriglobales bacterium]